MEKLPRGVSSKHIEIACNDTEIFGIEDDPYFRNLLAHSAQHATLAAELERLPGGAVVIDIGANVGLTSILAGRIVPAAKVIAVEPSPTTCECLRRTVDVNGLTGCRIVQMAIGDRCGTAAFVEREFLAGSSLSATGDGPTSVEMTTLDALVSELGLHRVDLVKIDVEGFEIDVLKGAAGIIGQHRPRFSMEWNPFAIMVNRRSSPWLLLEAVLDSFGSFETTKPGYEVVADERRALDFLGQSGRFGDVSDIAFGGR